ncbi:transcriptional regulator of acetoin/glycerol metabolism [Acidovorax soli]|uniref:Transcriptional regulator of acetoin/glycerol metabolism n=1 Tax=Acidovorax soli TaxID=592050 RepID=A0A7X0PAV6_9BURK|nr:sigma-54-dependent Fis family transcriptional regulator [Acidovorax soli]MBB6558274.1 transcriptional regulator of acetoin/glycerol metabolism [Acidovorax soli]
MHLEPTALAAPRDLIPHAHARSAAFGLRAQDTLDAMPLASADLRCALQRNRVLTDHALPVMETLYHQIAGTHSMVLLTDPEGVILHALGDDDFVARADRVALRPGGVWTEERKGTNAIGTALALGQAVQVHAGQHYLRANQFLTCSCVPILDPQGRALGAIDVSGDHRSQSKHTMALVRMSAQMVENHLWNQVHEDAVRLHFHARPEFLGTLVEGLAAFTPDGRFLSANRSGQFQLGLSHSALQAHTFGSLFGVDLGQVLDQCRRAPGALLTLRLPGGVTVVARPEHRPQAERLWIAADAAEPVRAPARPAARPGGLSGLRYLNTGDPALAQAIERVTKLLGRGIATLIQGETGTGKELLARAIHHDGPRRQAPFVAVNCASIPESLIESELFGYEEGAFTGARRKGSPGKIVQAHGGTLFLDEIGDMPLALQARLLRVLQERSVAPLGGTRQIEVDIQLVCATHRNLRAMMAEGSFRQDLYYRLNGLVVRLPALRERSDLAAIVQRILQSAADAGTPPLPVAPEVMALFARCAWPGNLRQLTNVLRTAALMAEGDTAIRREHLPEDFLEECEAAAAVPAAADAPAPAAQPLQAITAAAIAQALAAQGGNVSAVARALGVSRNTVYRHLRAQAA